MNRSIAIVGPPAEHRHPYLRQRRTQATRSCTGSSPRAWSGATLGRPRPGRRHPATVSRLRTSSGLSEELSRSRRLLPDAREPVEEATSDGRFAVVLGGDCSIVLGCLLGARKSAQGSVRLVSSAHKTAADFGRCPHCLPSILGAVSFGDVQQFWFDDWQRRGGQSFPRVWARHPASGERPYAEVRI